MGLFKKVKCDTCGEDRDSFFYSITDKKERDTSCRICRMLENVLGISKKTMLFDKRKYILNSDKSNAKSEAYRKRNDEISCRGIDALAKYKKEK